MGLIRSFDRIATREVRGSCHRLGSNYRREDAASHMAAVARRMMARVERLPLNLVKTMRCAISAAQASWRHCFCIGGRDARGLAASPKNILLPAIVAEPFPETVNKRWSHSFGRGKQKAQIG